MAACSYNTLYVYGAGLASINGTYLSSGDIDVDGTVFTKYTKDGNPSSLPCINAEVNPGPGDFYWEINASIPTYGVSPIYDTEEVPLLSFSNCPVGVYFKDVPGPWGVDIYGPAPTVSNTPDPYAPWGGLSNWLRLRLLEYV